MTDPEQRLKNAIGLAMKAGKLATGEFAAERALKRGEARLVMLDLDASDNTKKQWEDACRFRNLPWLRTGGLGQTIGKPERMIAVVTDDGFTKMIISAAEGCGESKNVDYNGGND